MKPFTKTIGITFVACVVILRRRALRRQSQASS